eukprot:CAMPEP_0203861190 /NCGR_PEP_ID=MMETSP0359-20131031/12863_1 /ASSEMBLY_ACC=CAM_ASM_000338 /TAXON_ID=268821 /ORGANISM="Scrippsiella Hangoei, Strain SHTV-5" /LENGTH=115 /DNA_ID=CAMNT_0050778379 /DNA_START=57 /DNA_END=404 /DNA_ORIENTATION=+
MEVEAASAVDVQALASLSVGGRVNFGLFQQAAVGSTLRVGGRVTELQAGAQVCTITTADGGSVQVAVGDVPLTGLAAGTFVEAVGTKAGEAELRDDAVNTAQRPQEPELFLPIQV